MKKILLLALLSTSWLFGQSTTVVMGPGTDGTTVTSCLGGLFDSGGTGAAADYDNDESYVVTICPDTPGDFIAIVWTIFDLDPTDLVPGPGTDADHITIYDGDDVTAPSLGDYYAGGFGVGSVIGASPFNPTGCLTIEFTSNATGTGNFNATFSCETPCSPPFADGIIVGADSPSGDSIAVCIGEEVTFTDNGSTPGDPLFTIEDWVWHWLDGTDDDTLAGPFDATHTYTEPGEYVVQLEVIDDNGCSNTNATNIRVYVAPEPNFDPFPGDTTLCIGESVTFSATPDAYEVEWSGFPLGVFIDDNCMEDDVGIVKSTPMTITGYDPTHTLSDLTPDILEICVDIEHSFMGDFVLQVQCPTGEIVTLHEQLGGGTDLGEPVFGSIDCDDPSTFGTPYNYCFTATAPETWEEAADAVATLPAGDYAMVEPTGFAALDGCPINGTWTLLFTDLWGGDDGSIPGWSITFADYLTPDVTVFTPYIGAGADSSFWDLTGADISSSTPDGDEITVTPSAPGDFDYTYTVIDNFGCTYDTTITISVDDPITMDAGLDTSICDGTPVMIGSDDLGGSAGCTYVLELVDTFGDGWNGNTIDVWVDGVLTNYTIPPGGDFLSIDIPVTHGATIELQFNDDGAWVSECEFTLFDPDGAIIHEDGMGFTEPSTALVSFTADCFGGVEFAWTPDDGSLDDATIPMPTASPSTTTTYTLSVWPTGHPLCVTTDDVTISIGGGMDAGDDGTATICLEGAPEDLFPYLLGTPQLGGNWFDPSGAPVAMPFDPATMPAGLYEYVRDSAGCTDNAFVDVTVIEVTGDVTVTDADCGACNGEIQVLPLTGTAPYTFSDDAGVTFVPGDTFTGLCGAGAVYSFILMDDNGCQGTVDATVNDTNFPTITSITPVDATCNTVCDGSVTIVGDFVTDFTITDPLGASTTNTTGSFTGLCPGDYDVLVDNGFGCTEVGTFTITEPTPVDITSLTGDMTICSGETVTLTVTGGGGVGPYNYTWDNAGIPLGTGETITLEPTAAMTVCVTMGEACPSPTDTECMTINVEPPIVPAMTSDVTSGCFPVTVQFTNLTDPTDVASTEWTFSDGGSIISAGAGGTSYVFETPGSYDVTMTITSAAGCISTETFTEYIEVYGYPQAAFSHAPIPATIFDPEITFTDASSDDVVGWAWNFGGAATPSVSNEQNPVVLFPEGVAAAYPIYLTVVNEEGCADSVQATVNIVNDVIIYAPNVFTPDGDEFNETWRVYIEGIDIYDFHLTIFNRWGEMIWESFNSVAEWNGTYGSQGLVPDGTYVWIIEAKDSYNDKRYEFRGHVTVLK
ncbi:MAG: PKD domain-containing protein [Crocinitomicaceae bacterium]|nr:PKD domain-containing protein [Crocinitomicaceae bacterium]